MGTNNANNVCWKYSIEPIASTGWVRLKLNNTYAVRWVDANRVCASLGKRLPSTSELVEGWDGVTLYPEDGLCTTSTSLGNAFREKMSYKGVIWTSDVRIAPLTKYASVVRMRVIWTSDVRIAPWIDI